MLGKIRTNKLRNEVNVTCVLILLVKAVFYDKIYTVNIKLLNDGFTPLDISVRQGKLKKCLTGFTLVGLMISMSIIILLAAIAIPQVLRARMVANEAAARATLKTISTALETYYANDGGGYPTDISVLITANPAFLNKDYIADSPYLGYNFACESLELGSYSCSATPQDCGRTGSKIYTITTSSVFSEADCP